MYPEEFEKCDDQTKIKIIEIGTYIYFNGYSLNNEKSFLEKEQSYESQIKKLKFDYEQHVFDLKKHYEQTVDSNSKTQQEAFKQSLSMLINEKENQLSFLKTQLEEKEKHYATQVETIHNMYKSQVEGFHKRIQELEKNNSEALDISTRLDNLIGKKTSMDNAAKGDFGESIVQNQILNEYPKSVIIDTSGQTARGDMLWKLDDDTFRALVEVKNVQYVRQSDVQKFERDIGINVQDKSCNCGLFVSLKTDIIQSKGSFSFEFFEGVPVLYVSNIFLDSNLLKLALNILYTVQKNYKQHSDETNVDINEQLHIQNLISSMYNSLVLRKKDIEDCKDHLETLCKKIVNQQNYIENDIQSIEAVCRNVKWCTFHYSNTDTGAKRQKLLDAVRSFYEEHKRWPTTKDIIDKHSDIKKNHFRGSTSMHNIKTEVEKSLNLCNPIHED